MSALSTIEAEIDRLEGLLAGLHHAARLLLDDDDQDDELEEDEEFECDQCDATFGKAHGLRIHKARSHKHLSSFDHDEARARAAAAL